MLPLAELEPSGERPLHVLNLLVEVERLHVLAVVGVPPPGPGDGPV